MIRILRHTLLALVAAAIVVYLCVVGYLYVNQRQLLYAARPELETPAITGLAIQDVRITTKDGETLQAWYEPPQKGRPVILFFHGNGDALTMGKWRYTRMHKAGVGYLALSYRGYGGSTGIPTETGLLTDGLAAYDWLRTQGLTDEQIVIHGHSLGSGVATYVATQRPARALLLEAPFTATCDVASERYPLIPACLLMHDRFLNRERIKDVHIPVLIAHGDQDSVVPFSQGKHLFELANSPKVFVKMKGSEHNTLTRDGVYNAYWRFLGLPKDPADPVP